eukprot:gene10708-biopygen6521
MIYRRMRFRGIGQANPGGHGVHAVCPPTENVPGSQSSKISDVVVGHAFPLGHNVHAADPAIAKVPSGQSLQTPAVLEYVPGSHKIGLAGSTQDRPGRHCAQWSAPAKEKVPDGHKEQPTLPPRLYVPAGQITGSAAGSKQEYPLGHGRQLVRPVSFAKRPFGQTIGRVAGLGQ